jgi:molybdate transport system substrate-binding protein
MAASTPSRRPRIQAVTSASLALLGVLLATTGMAACTSTRPGAGQFGRLTGGLTVLASTSLTEVIARLATAFETAHPQVRVQPRVGPDTQLVTAVRGGAQADVLILEGPEPLAALASPAPPSEVFARNQVVIAVPLGNPKRISTLDDLTRPGIRAALCEPTQPCGLAVDTMLRRSGVHLSSPLLVTDVRAARAAVQTGAADAALVYRTDTRAAADLIDTVELTQSRDLYISYQAVALPGSANPDAARAFVSYLMQPSTLAFLTAAAFQPPA